MRTTVVVFDSLGHQAEVRGRLRCTWRCDCRISATRLGRGRALRALWQHLRAVHHAGVPCPDMVPDDDRDLGELRFLLSRIEIICPTCGAHAPEGLLHHDCAHPGPQPHPTELLDEG